jgi:uncharacterized membrane protein
MATGVSADGAVVIGVAGEQSFLFRWTAETGFDQLPLVSINASGSPPRISADGLVIVGTRFLPPPPGSIHPQTEAFRWTEAEGLVGLGNIGGGRLATSALAVSADGSVIVGVDNINDSPGPLPTKAYYSSGPTGMVDLRDYLISNGVTGLGNWNLTQAWAVSADGATIVGTGTHEGITEAWVATIPEPSTIILAALAAIALLLLFSASQRLRGSIPR